MVCARDKNVYIFVADMACIFDMPSVKRSPVTNINNRGIMVCNQALCLLNIYRFVCHLSLNKNKGRPNRAFQSGVDPVDNSNRRII